MKKYTVKIKITHFNYEFTVNYEAEENKLVSLFTNDGFYLGTFINGENTKSISPNNDKIIVEI